MSVHGGRLSSRTEWLGIHEAATLIGVSPATLRRWSDAGDIDAYTTPGGHRRFSRAAVVGLLPPEAGTTPSTEQLERVRAHIGRVVRAASRTIAGDAPWVGAFDDDDRADTAIQGRRIVDGLIAALDERTAVDAGRAPGPMHAAAACGELAARRGVGLGSMIEAGLRLDGIAVHEVAAAADHLGLDGPTTARWLDVVAGTLDRLLSEAMRAHALADGASTTAAPRRQVAR